MLPSTFMDIKSLKGNTFQKTFTTYKSFRGQVSRELSKYILIKNFYSHDQQWNDVLQHSTNYYKLTMFWKEKILFSKPFHQFFIFNYVFIAQLLDDLVYLLSMKKSTSCIRRHKNILYYFINQVTFKLISWIR